MPDVLTLSNETVQRIAAAVAAALKGGPPPAAAPQQDPADPWDAPWPDAPSGAAAPPAASPPPSSATPASGTEVDKNGRTWTFGAPNAPACKHGQPAAFVQGSTNGKAWQQYRCARAFGSDYKSKCDFSEFVGDRK